MTVTLTVLVLPSSVSVTVQSEPAWMPLNVFDGDPVAPAAMSKVPTVPSLQLTAMLTWPWLPAAGPVISFVTIRSPGTCV